MKFNCIRIILDWVDIAVFKFILFWLSHSQSFSDGLILGRTVRGLGPLFVYWMVRLCEKSVPLLFQESLSNQIRIFQFSLYYCQTSLDLEICYHLILLYWIYLQHSLAQYRHYKWQNLLKQNEIKFSISNSSLYVESGKLSRFYPIMKYPEAGPEGMKIKMMIRIKVTFELIKINMLSDAV